jgi:aspartate/methionine/tyrosine aminotransferase
MKKLSGITKGLIGQPMFHLLSKVKEMERAGKEIIHFEIGDPNFDTPIPVLKAAKNSLDKGETHYTDSMGLWDLRQEICSFTEKILGYRPKVGQVFIIPANAIIDFVIRCVVDPGEEVIFPDPGFPTYFSVINYAGMKPVPIALKEKNGFRMNPDDIRKAITDRTRLIIINSPNNPTGSMMTQEEVAEVAKIAKEHDAYLLSDEVYSGVIYEKAHYSPSIYDQCQERTITLNSFSKIYSMSGWRLGYAIGPAALITKMGLLLETIISCLPPFIQRGGVAALISCQELVKKRNEELCKRRDILIRGLNTIPGISCLLPDGAFYAFANIRNTGLTATYLVNILLEKAGVAVLDGECFGRYGEGYVRLCYASTPLETIERAIEKIKQTVKKEGITDKNKRTLEVNR